MDVNVSMGLDVEPWRTQSALTWIEPFRAVFDALPDDLAGLRGVSQQLVTHYMFSGEGGGPVKGERLAETDIRYADAMIRRLLELGPPSLIGERPTAQRIVGCCRDFALLFVTMARHKGFPARIRVGYAGYFQPGWYLDHVVAEVWDKGTGRWRLIEPEISDDFEPADSDGRFDPLDIPPERFVTGARAWLAARAGRLDPERCVVAPDFDEPYTRSWLSLRHHVVQDLAALNKAEMLLWDQWGILNEDDPLGEAALLDQLAQTIADPGCPAEEIAGWARREGLAVPPTVISYSPTQPEPLTVDVSRTLAGTLSA